MAVAEDAAQQQQQPPGQGRRLSTRPGRARARALQHQPGDGDEPELDAAEQEGLAQPEPAEARPPQQESPHGRPTHSANGRSCSPTPDRLHPGGNWAVSAAARG